MFFIELKNFCPGMKVKGSTSNRKKLSVPKSKNSHKPLELEYGDNLQGYKFGG